MIRERGLDIHSLPYLQITEALFIALDRLDILLYKLERPFGITNIEQLRRDDPAYLIHTSKADQRIASEHIEVDIGERLQMLRLLDLGHQFEKEAQFTNLNGLLHDIHAVQIIDDD